MIGSISDLSTEWLSSAIGFDVLKFKATEIGTGQIGDIYRIELQYGSRTRPGPASVVVKLATQDPTGRSLGVDYGLYEREVSFYQHAAPLMPTAPIASSYDADLDRKSGEFFILLEDCAPARAGSDLQGSTLDEAKLAMSELGRLHGIALKSVKVEAHPWLRKAAWAPQQVMEQFWQSFMGEFSGSLKPKYRMIGQQFIRHFEKLQEIQLAPSTPQGLVHGDYRLDNMMLMNGKNNNQQAIQPLILLDWQTCCWGPIIADVAFFLATSLDTRLRRDNMESLVHDYHDSLSTFMPNAMTFAECMEGLRTQCFAAIRQAITAASVAKKTERGQELFRVMFERGSEFAADLRGFLLLPGPPPGTHIVPKPEDEQVHAFGTHELHNESWYFDAVDPDQAIGLWLRLGINPNQKGTWYNALVCGPQMPTIVLCDFNAAHPGSDLTLSNDRYHATHEPLDPLRKYRTTLKGRGEAFDDPSAILRGESGRSVDIEMDLLFETEGEPYQWRMTTRYEMPCKVTGTVSWEGQSVSLKGVNGQRDHSWGARDWWSADWMWTAFHFEDGTHTHHVHWYAEEFGVIDAGYIQKHGKLLEEATEVHATYELGSNGLVDTTSIIIVPSSLKIEAKVIGHAPLLLKSPDGRIDHFHRGWVTVTSNDGRKGVGFIEWNLNQ